ncbi:MAG: ABC transporter permease subunit [Bacilli bacterium]
MQGIGVPVKLVTFLSGITSTIYRTISYSGIQILIFLTAIQSVPKHLYEAATIEGATGYEQFWKITLPMVSPMILTVVVYTIVDSFLRLEIGDVMDKVYNNNEYGYYAAMSWLYILASLLIMGIIVGILSKVVFYYDDKK